MEALISLFILFIGPKADFGPNPPPPICGTVDPHKTCIIP